MTHPVKRRIDIRNVVQHFARGDEVESAAIIAPRLMGQVRYRELGGRQPPSCALYGPRADIQAVHIPAKTLQVACLVSLTAPDSSMLSSAPN